MSEVNENGDFNSWWAHVKYCEPHGTETLPVSKIEYEYTTKKGITKRKAFQPDSFTDYDPNCWYVAYSEKDLPAGQEGTYPCLIGKIAASEEDIGRKPRHRFAVVSEPAREPQTDCGTSEAEVGIIEKQKQERARKRALKRTSDVVNLTEFLANNSNKETEEESVEALKQKVKKLEEQLAARNLSLQTSFSSTDIETSMKEGFEEMGTQITELRSEIAYLKTDNEKLNAMIEELLSESRSSPLPNNFVQDWLNSLN